MVLKFLFATGVGVSLCLPISAEEVDLPGSSKNPAKPIEATRPRQAQSPHTVEEGHVQLEVGSAYQRFRDNGVQVSVPATLRVGVSEMAEIRVQSGPNGYQGTGTSTNSLIGVKLNLQEKPGLGLLVNLNVPVGLTSGHHGPVPELRFLSTFDLSEELELYLNAGVSLQVDAKTGERFAEFGWAEQLKQKLSDDVSFYTEVFGNTPSQFHGSTLVAADAGFLWLVSRNVQLDLGAVKGLSGDGLDWALTAGCSARF